MSKKVCGDLTLKGGAEPFLGIRTWKYRGKGGWIFSYGMDPWTWAEVKDSDGNTMASQSVSGLDQAGKVFARFSDEF